MLARFAFLRNSNGKIIIIRKNTWLFERSFCEFRRKYLRFICVVEKKSKRCFKGFRIERKKGNAFEITTASKSWFTPIGLSKCWNVYTSHAGVRREKEQDLTCIGKTRGSSLNCESTEERFWDLNLFLYSTGIEKFIELPKISNM